jgi:predicted nucleic acid-binding protein
LDAHVLSRLAQIGGVDLIPQILPGKCTIAPAIYDEISVGIEGGVAYLGAVATLVEQGEVRLLDLEQADRDFFASIPRKLARGEAEGITLCRRLDMTFVTHDRKAADYCALAVVRCLHFRTLVEALHGRGLLTDAELQQALA